MIYVTQTFLPPKEEYQSILEESWSENWITNRGRLVQRLENDLKDYLKVKNILLTANGTLPIQIAIKTLKLNGEIITTPFSYVATTSAIVWENCTPVFVDINSDYLTIDESKIEDAITENTSAILATHVFGNPCNVKKIEEIAKKFDLKVIYDAAHCFGVTYNNKSIFNYGDISTCSFHATKLFHTAEGGGLFTKSKRILDSLFYHHNFGHKGPKEFHGLGINAKMSELQAAMGLAVLPYIDNNINQRKIICKNYTKAFENFDEIQLLKIRKKTKWNYCYFPIIFNSENQLLKAKEHLAKHHIFARRYFYPSLNNLPYIKGQIKMPISESISKRVLCLPLYPGLEESEVLKISSIILKEF